MSRRITKADLQRVLDMINDATGNPREATVYTEGVGITKWNEGTYILQWVYGGVRLAQVSCGSGTDRNITIGTGMTIRDFILSRLTPHICTEESCGYGHNNRHTGCFELSSDVFIRATQMTPKRRDGTPQAPD